MLDALNRHIAALRRVSDGNGLAWADVQALADGTACLPVKLDRQDLALVYGSMAYEASLGRRIVGRLPLDDGELMTLQGGSVVTRYKVAVAMLLAASVRAAYACVASDAILGWTKDIYWKQIAKAPANMLPWTGQALMDLSVIEKSIKAGAYSPEDLERYLIKYSLNLVETARTLIKLGLVANVPRGSPRQATQQLLLSAIDYLRCGLTRYSTIAVEQAPIIEKAMHFAQDSVYKALLVDAATGAVSKGVPVPAILAASSVHTVTSWLGGPGWTWFVSAMGYVPHLFSAGVGMYALYKLQGPVRSSMAWLFQLVTDDAAPKPALPSSVPATQAQLLLDDAEVEEAEKFEAAASSALRALGQAVIAEAPILALAASMNERCAMNEEPTSSRGGRSSAVRKAGRKAVKAHVVATLRAAEVRVTRARAGRRPPASAVKRQKKLGGGRTSSARELDAAIDELIRAFGVDAALENALEEMRRYTAAGRALPLLEGGAIGSAIMRLLSLVMALVMTATLAHTQAAELHAHNSNFLAIDKGSLPYALTRSAASLEPELWGDYDGYNSAAFWLREAENFNTARPSFLGLLTSTAEEGKFERAAIMSRIYERLQAAMSYDTTRWTAVDAPAFEQLRVFSFRLLSVETTRLVRTSGTAEVTALLTGKELGMSNGAKLISATALAIGSLIPVVRWVARNARRSSGRVVSRLQANVQRLLELLVAVAAGHQGACNYLRERPPILSVGMASATAEMALELQQDDVPALLDAEDPMVQAVMEDAEAHIAPPLAVENGDLDLADFVDARDSLKEAPSGRQPALKDASPLEDAPSSKHPRRGRAPCEDLAAAPTTNPCTGRRIKPGGPTSKALQQACDAGVEPCGVKSSAKKGSVELEATVNPCTGRRITPGGPTATKLQAARDAGEDPCGAKGRLQRVSPKSHVDNCIELAKNPATNPCTGRRIKHGGPTSIALEAVCHLGKEPCVAVRPKSRSKSPGRRGKGRTTML